MMEEKKKNVIAPQEMVEELDDADLVQVSGGATSYIGGAVRQSTQRDSYNFTSNMSNIANSAEVTGQKKYTLGGIAGRITAKAPTQTDEQ